MRNQLVKRFTNSANGENRLFSPLVIDVLPVAREFDSVPISPMDNVVPAVESLSHTLDQLVLIAIEMHSNLMPGGIEAEHHASSLD
jgi:hypothetical protein